MKNHELLDLIGEAREEYVLAAGDGAARPRVRWKTWAACAACAALVLCAYPIYRASLPQESRLPPAESRAPVAPEGEQEPGRTLIQRPGLHDYTLIDQEVRVINTYGTEGAKVPAGAGEEGPADATKPAYYEPAYYATVGTPPAPAPDPAEAPTPEPVDGDVDVPVQEVGDAQYRSLFAVYQGARANDPMMKWFGGTWVNQPDGLTVAIVEGCRNQAMEEQVIELAGGGDDRYPIVFVDVKYSQHFLDGLMAEIGRVFGELDCRISSAYGVHVMENRIQLDLFGVPGDDVLAALAELDPDGDAIFIQVFADGHLAFTDELVKGPPREETPEPVDDAARATPVLPAEDSPAPEPTPIDCSDPVPGGATQPETEELTPFCPPENWKPAMDPNDFEFTVPPDPGPDELPQAKYDVPGADRGEINFWDAETMN